VQNNVKIQHIICITRKKIILVITIDLIFVILKEKKDLLKRDFLFELTILKIYTYFVNFEFEFINIRNNKNVSLKLSNCCRINCIVKYKNKKCYAIKEKHYFLTTISFFEDYSILFKLNSISVEIRSLREIIFKKIKT